MKLGLSVLTALGILLAVPAQAATVTWTDWTSKSPGTVVGDVGGVGVTYTGSYEFAQLGLATETNFWTEGSPAPYTGSALIDNAPTPSEMVALNGSGTHTLTFAEALLNPIMTIVSLGRTNLPVAYDFDSPFSVLSEGRGYWGDGSYTLSAGDVLTGYELHAAIQFSGLLKSISWTSNPSENWHGITLGTVAAIPLPAGLPLILSAVGLLGFLGYRRRTS